MKKNDENTNWHMQNTSCLYTIIMAMFLKALLKNTPNANEWLCQVGGIFFSLNTSFK